MNTIDQRRDWFQIPDNSMDSPMVADRNYGSYNLSAERQFGQFNRMPFTPPTGNQY
jgi:hypothetical protein